MLGLPLVLLVQHVQGFPIEGQIRIVDAVRQLPRRGAEIDLLLFGGGGVGRVHVGDEVVLVLGGGLLVRARLRVGRHSEHFFLGGQKAGLGGKVALILCEVGNRGRFR